MCLGGVALVLTASYVTRPFSMIIDCDGLNSGFSVDHFKTDFLSSPVHTIGLTLPESQL